jgi:ketosteroid isomerase-like protein
MTPDILICCLGADNILSERQRETYDGTWFGAAGRRSWSDKLLIEVETMTFGTKAMLTLLTTSAFGGGLAACGGSGRSPSASNAARVDSRTATTSARTLPPGGYLKSDGDNDADDEGKARGTDDQQGTLAEGRAADDADKRAVTRVVRGYYAAAAAGDGARGCSLLASGIATAVAERQLQSGGAKTCAASLSLLFKQQRQRLAAEEVDTMVVTGVRISGSDGFAALGFSRMPEGGIVVQREGAVWKVDALFESTVP